MQGTALLDRECVFCGVAMVRYTIDGAPCPAKIPGCCVNHMQEVVRCLKCGGSVYSYTSDDGQEQDADG